MKIPCVIDNVKTLKKGMKITLSVNDEHTKQTMKQIYNFLDRDLIVNVSIDAEAEKEKLGEISNQQRKKIYAMFRDIADATGNNKETVKDEMKVRFIKNTDYPKEKFSLSNMDKEYAARFIEYIIDFCFEYGIPLSDIPYKELDDDSLERYLKMCIKQGKCSICGREGETHHVDTIGMGNNRKTLDDSKHRKIQLCREHHTEAHNEGWETFEEKHHVKGVLYDENS